MGLFEKKKSDASRSEKSNNLNPTTGDIFRGFLARQTSFRNSSSRSAEGAPPPTYQEAALAPPAAFQPFPAPAPPVGFSAPGPPVSAPVRQATIRNTPIGPPDYSGLSKVDTLFVIDDSSSMCGANWEQTSVALAAIVPICTAHDSDGVDVHFLNHRQAYSNIRSSDQFLALFDKVRPFGVTPTGRKLGEILETYIKLYRQNKRIKPLNVIVITDGEATDPDKLEKCIVDCATQLDRMQAPDRQVGVQFFQVGGDQAAAESLEELDNALAEEYCIRDMVDTVSWKKMNNGNGLTADGILKAVLGAMDKTLDRKRR